MIIFVDDIHTASRHARIRGESSNRGGRLRRLTRSTRNRKIHRQAFCVHGSIRCLVVIIIKPREPSEAPDISLYHRGKVNHPRLDWTSISCLPTSPYLSRSATGLDCKTSIRITACGLGCKTNTN
jgi:hypothetical protein